VSATEIEALCRIWQERLRLQDWDITVKVVRLHEFDHKGTAGDAETFIAKQCAVIRLVEHNDRLPDTMVPYDDEMTLVHELLHVHFKSSQPEIDEDSLPWQEHERAIHRVSEALVRAYRCPVLTDETPPGRSWAVCAYNGCGQEFIKGTQEPALCSAHR
jgi:hypothetical protein